MDTSHTHGTLVVIRHAESEWNLLGKWTGHTDVGLTEKGARESRMIGEVIQGITFDRVYSSDLKRTKETLAGVFEGKGQSLADVPQTADPAINERDYGDYTGKNKWEIKEQVGDETFNAIRRNWDEKIPGGETLKDVYERAVPYFQEEILPHLRAGETVGLFGHGNTIRAFMKYFEQVSDDDIAHIEMPFGKVLIYTFDETSELPVGKEIRQAAVGETKA
jgi:2,3-bisphosphoglycerate-dependent phosphoglycerate mutase